MFTILILILSVAVGPLIVEWFKPQDRKKIRILTAFSGAYVFSITALHLMPEAFGHDEGAEVEAHAHLAGGLVLAGFFVQLLLDYFSQGIEHGHAHSHNHDGKIPLGIMVGLCVHAFVEGMPLGSGTGHEHAHGLSEATRHSLLLGIVMHNIPVSIVLMSLLLHEGVCKKRALVAMGVFAMMSPLGLLLSEQVEFLSHYSHELMAFVVGIFLHISTTILFETGEEHRVNRLKAIAIAAGAGLALLGIWFQPH